MSKGFTYAKTPSLQRLALIAVTIVANTALSASISQAASFEIVDGETVTTQQTLNDNETGTIQAGGQLNTAATAVTASGINNIVNNDGSISTTGGNSLGIVSQGVNATLCNSGTISTTGDYSYGIYSHGISASITTSGTISTTGEYSYGIYSDGISASITNSDTISTIGDDSYGIYSEGISAIITNSGTISTTGINGLGIYSDGANAVISNSGNISSSGNSGYGIASYADNAVISNSGTISTTGLAAYGIASSVGADNAVITNTGSISTIGSNGDSIRSLGDFATIVNSGHISTTGDSARGIVSQGDNATIVNSGHISTSGVSALGIYSDGLSANIINSGSIFTSGNGSYGISSWSNFATIVNSGTISTTGDIASGIYSEGNNAVITNSGTISTTGDNALGFYSSGDNAVITNSGSISTTGGSTSAFRTYGDNTSITNSGIISTTGPLARVIETYGDNTAISNSGTISTAGLASLGIFADGDTSTIANSGSITITGDNGVGIATVGPNITINNSGSISTTGDNGVGIDAAETNTTINNSGLIASTGANGYAIDGDTDTTLNLLPGSRIIGRIDLGNNGGDLDTVNIHGIFGSSVLNFENTEVINLYTDNAVKIGNTVVVVEPTGESARAASLNTLATGVHQVIGQRMQRTPAKQPIQLAALTLSPGMLHQDRQPVAWGQVFGSKGERAQEGQMLAYDSHLGGVVIGYEQDFGKCRAGVLVGAATGTTETAMTDTDTDSVFLGVYNHVFLGPVNLTVTLIGGNEAHDTQRQVLDNMNGYETATSNTDSYFISPSLTLGSSYVLTPKIDLRPSATVTYSGGRYDGYEETGTTNANLQVDSRTVHALSTRLQLEAAQRVAAGEISLRAGIQTRHTDSGTIEMHLGGSDFRFNAAGDENVAGGFIGCGTQLLLSDRLSLVADAEYGQMSGNETQVAGQVTLQYQF
ncbi:autotransporter outer membrane beta-barrel domain-containing protein [Thiovibrio frasassiensis]|uniref:Autotransporter domain-containing protein n=1 Tax=Thiovibrio frasassiensis TaxID=2984131 RepID=A0A9X4MKZ4_9BACT|nr:autotransporter domain-containing protein [Thiovibrio frasassiensis]MDG4476734.1 autotransporter domain-containing protein [Thiovibrio frasassiensis]